MLFENVVLAENMNITAKVWHLALLAFVIIVVIVSVFSWVINKFKEKNKTLKEVTERANLSEHNMKSLDDEAKRLRDLLKKMAAIMEHCIFLAEMYKKTDLLSSETVLTSYKDICQRAKNLSLTMLSFHILKDLQKDEISSIVNELHRDSERLKSILENLIK
ncbi:MAG: hypothetical protein GY793_00540 [Proteobacteria bacterium]|nr:hypothetical protein [Pseudomonadota bacterium]